MSWYKVQNLRGLGNAGTECERWILNEMGVKMLEKMVKMSIE